MKMSVAGRDPADCNVQTGFGIYIKFNLNTGEKLKQQRNFNALNVIVYSQQILIWKLTLDQFILVSNVNLDRKLEENP